MILRFSNYNYFSILLLCVTSVCFAQEQTFDTIFSKQESCFVPPIASKQYRLKGNVKNLEIITSIKNGNNLKTHQILCFSKTGLLLKSKYYNENSKNEVDIRFYHYNKVRLDSITKNDKTSKEAFFYDNQNRLIKKIDYGIQVENKNDIREVEHFFYNKKNYIIKSIKDSLRLITECEFNNDNQVTETKLHYINDPQKINIYGNHYGKYKDKVDYTTITNNGKIISKSTFKYDNKKYPVEYTHEDFLNKIKIITTIKRNFDQHDNVILKTESQKDYNRIDQYLIEYFTEKDLNEIDTPIEGKYPEASQRFLTKNDLIGLNANEIKILRNEIYARHGYIFKNKELKNYFGQQSWYIAIYDDVSCYLSGIEKNNIAFIKENFE